MSETEIVPVQENRLTERLTATQIRADVNLIQEVMAAVMKKDVHYGTVPGCGDKPTLLKPGAEKIASTFRLAIEPVVEDLSTDDVIRYRIVTKVTHQTSGIYLGSGIGEASSGEDKYKWRKVISPAEWDATPEDRRRVKFGRDYTTQQVRTNASDVANTVLKMAKKRSLVDAVLTITAASDIFTQDIEDMPEELATGVAGPTEPAVQTPKAKAPAPEPEPKSGPDKTKMRLMESKKDGACAACGESTLNTTIYWDGNAKRAYHKDCL